MESRLFKECIEALTPGVEILSQSDSAKMWALFKKKLPIAFWGRMDWEKITSKLYVASAADVVSSLKKLLHKNPNEQIYVFWNDASLPVLKASLSVAIKFIDDVTCVGPDTWFVNFEEGYIVEFFHEGEIVVGRIDVPKTLLKEWKDAINNE